NCLKDAPATGNCTAATTTTTTAAAIKVKQRGLDMDSSTESDGDDEATNGNGGSTTTATNATSASNGPMTRKVWSDWCSSKLQSDDEENYNSNSNNSSQPQLAMLDPRVLSTSLDALNLIGCPAPGNQQLTSLVTGDMYHRGLDIPVAPQDTPYAQQILLDVFRSQYMNLIEQMRASAYLSQVQKQIAQEQERMARLKNRASQLDKQIKVLIDDSVTLLKVRMNELGINVNSPMI
ncbi:hypothetical protein ACLKA7_000067, partial [Drosophila subpalustris]